MVPDRVGSTKTKPVYGLLLVLTLAGFLGCGGSSGELDVERAGKIAQEFCRCFAEGPRRDLERLVSANYINASKDLQKWKTKSRREKDVEFQGVKWGQIDRGPSSIRFIGCAAVYRKSEESKTTVFPVLVVVGLTGDGYRVTSHVWDDEAVLIEVRGKKRIDQAVEEDSKRLTNKE